MNRAPATTLGYPRGELSPHACIKCTHKIFQLASHYPRYCPFSYCRNHSFIPAAHSMPQVLPCAPAPLLLTAASPLLSALMLLSSATSSALCVTRALHCFIRLTRLLTQSSRRRRRNRSGASGALDL